MDTYPEITDEQREQISDLFYDVPDSIRITSNSDGYYVTLKNTYEYVKFKAGTLMGFMSLASILGCTEGDEVGRYCVHGCPTCDYGSSYELTLKFWNRKE